MLFFLTEATPVSDFSRTLLDNFFIPEGTVSSAETCFNITLVPDMLFEKDEEFYITIVPMEDNVDAVEYESTTVTIQDDESMAA